jgi:hypothetical protein
MHAGLDMRTSLRRGSAITALLAVSMLGACGDEKRATAVRSPAELPLYADGCPLAHIRGVRAVAADVPGGVAVVFTASDRAIDLVRANVRAMATASVTEGNPFAVCPCGLPGNDLAQQPMVVAGWREFGVTSMQPPSPTPVLPPAAATVNETFTGATLVLISTDSADADLLRLGARHAVDAMTGCLTK